MNIIETKIQVTNHKRYPYILSYRTYKLHVQPNEEIFKVIVKRVNDESGNEHITEENIIIQSIKILEPSRDTETTVAI